MHRQAEVAIRNEKDNSIRKCDEEEGPIITKNPNVFQSILASKSLPAVEKEKNRIAQEAFVVLVAGGETTARVLTTATFHLLANKGTALARLKKELFAAMEDPDVEVDVKALEQLPWLVPARWFTRCGVC